MCHTLRQYQATDLNDVLNSWHKANGLAHPFLAEDFISNERHNIEHLYLPNADTWVLEYNDKVVGFIALIGNEIGGLFVDPLFHKKGFGKALMVKAKSLHKSLELDVFEQNAFAKAFYARQGFVLKTQSIHASTGQPVLRLMYVQ
jgi:putative acetyltransferase